MLRRRSGWEAAELGILLWQMNWKALVLFFGIPMTLCVALLRFMPEPALQIGGLAVWWLLPLLDRFALQVVSVRFFDPHAPLKNIFNGLGKNLVQGLPGDLLWRRFSPFRSARMPITVLEKIKGPALRKRKQLLSRNGLDFGFPLTMICLVLESALGFGELAFIFAIGQLFFPWYFTDLSSFTEEGLEIVTLVTWVNSILVESLYICMGFGIYINSRVETEGWDIELLFKKIAEKKKKSPKVQTPALARLVPVLALLLASMVVAFPAGAEETTVEETVPSAELLEPETTAASDAALLQEVLASPDFGQHKDSWKIQLKEKMQDLRLPEPLQFRKFPNLEKFFGIVIRTAAVLAIASALGISVYLLYKRRRSAAAFAFNRKEKGILHRTEKADADALALLEKAAALHGEGKIREGWALCFRAFLAALDKWSIHFPDDATEYEALALTRRKNIESGCREKFENFIEHWVSFAYGGRKAAAGIFDAAINDCKMLLTTEAAQ
jgi:hypothetical protein